MTRRSSELVVSVYGDRLCDPFRAQLDPYYGINDIALALSHICRWGGRCSPFYSVAEHSIHVAAILTETDLPQDEVLMLILHGLLHDASESLVGDIPTPLKSHLEVWTMEGSSGFGYLEANLQRAILKQLGVPEVTKAQKEHIAAADKRALAWEAKYFMGNPSWAPEVNPEDDMEPEDYMVDPGVAREQFLSVYIQCMSACKDRGLLVSGGE